MRFPLCVAFLTVCILAWECTASEEGSDKIVKDSEGASEAAVTATTTTVAPTTPIQVQQQIRAQESDPNHVEDTHREAEQDVGHVQAEHPKQSKEKESEHQTDAHAEPEIQSRDQPERRDAPVDVAASPATTKTTTTTENLNSVQNPKGLLEQAKNNQTPDINSGHAAHAKEPEKQIHQDVGEADLSHGDAAQNPAGQKSPQVRDGSADLSDVKSPSSTEVKTATATAAVEKPSGPKEDTGKEQSNGHAKKETPNLEVKDAIQAGQTTDTAVTKRGGESAQSTPPSGGATGGKKEQKASLVPSGTTDTSEKKDDHAAITPGTNTGEKEIIQEQKQKSITTTTTEPTTSTGAPTTTLSKGFKLPQSLDKTDGSKSSSVLIAFVTVVTFLVIAVTPLY